MKKLLWGALCLCLPLASHAFPRLAPGQWSTTIHMIMPGMPFTPAPRTFSHCLTQANSKIAPKQMVGTLVGGDCKLDKFSTSGNRAHWEMTCRGKHAKQGSGTLIVNDAKHYKVNSKVTLLDVGGTMQINSQSHWTGQCH